MKKRNTFFERTFGKHLFLGVFVGLLLAFASSAYAAGGGSWTIGNDFLNFKQQGETAEVFMGVGEANPAAKLDVNGKIRSQSTVDADSGRIVVTKDYLDGKFLVFPKSKWEELNGNVYRNDGNVGVGTSNPSARFSVTAGATESKPASIFSGFGNTLGDISFPLGESLEIGSWDDVSKKFVGMMFISGNGNVGIGDSNPATKLSVDGEIDFKGMKWDNGENITMRGTGEYSFDFSENAGASSFHVWAPSAGSLFSVKSDGKVGIGMANPVGILHVDLSNTSLEEEVIFGLVADKTLKIKNNGTGGGARFETNGNSVFRSSGGGVYFQDYTTGVTGSFVATNKDTASFFNVNGGNVGIGTATPNAKLHVFNGSIISGIGSTNGSTIIEGYYDQASTGGATGLLGTSYSSGGISLNYGARNSSTAANQFVSSLNSALARTALVSDNTGFHYFTGAMQTVAIGNPIAMTEKMTLTTDGNLGIGTTTPLHKLQVVGDFRLGADGNAEHILTGINPSIAYTDYKTNNTTLKGNHGFDFANNRYFINTVSTTANTIMNTAGGNVGIGATAPSAKLHVYDAAYAVARVESTNAGSSVQLNLKSAADGYPHILFTQGTTNRFEIGKTANNGNLYFNNNTQTGEAGSAMVIGTNGNVGIGTTNPTEKLTISGDVRLGEKGSYTGGSANYGKALVFSGANGLINGYSGDNSDPQWIARYNVGSNASELRVSMGDDSTGDSLKIGYCTGSGGEFTLGCNWIPTAIFDSSGNVGIGTTSPSQKLDIAGNIKIDGAIVSPEGTLRDDGGGWVRTYGATGWYSQTYGGGWYMLDSLWVRSYSDKGVWTGSGLLGSNGGLTIGYGGATSPGGGAIISGNVGIGTSAPSEKLEINGNVKATEFFYSSDKRWKKGIQPVDEALQKILKMEGVSFYWDKENFPEKNFSSQKQIGFIAQDVEKIFPELVGTDANGYKSVQYGNITSVLVQAMKELKQEKDEEILFLKQQNAEKDRQIAEILQRLEVLEQ